MTGYDGDPFHMVEVLERELAAAPGDHELRHRLALAFEASTVAARSLTRDQRLVLTSRRQVEFCEHAARRILDLQVGDQRLVAGARALLAEVGAARRWVWQSRGEAIGWLVAGSIVGLSAAIAGGLAGSIALVVGGAVVSGAGAAAVVLRYRREQWSIWAEQARLVIWRPGV